jgi:hypothetical protein
LERTAAKPNRPHERDGAEEDGERSALGCDCYEIDLCI